MSKLYYVLLTCAIVGIAFIIGGIVVKTIGVFYFTEQHGCFGERVEENTAREAGRKFLITVGDIFIWLGVFCFSLSIVLIGLLSDLFDKK